MQSKSNSCENVFYYCVLGKMIMDRRFLFCYGYFHLVFSLYQIFFSCCCFVIFCLFKNICWILNYRQKSVLPASFWCSPLFQFHARVLISFLWLEWQHGMYNDRKVPRCCQWGRRRFAWRRPPIGMRMCLNERLFVKSFVAPWQRSKSGIEVQSIYRFLHKTSWIKHTRA